ncbi:unnamed protein product [Dicrocoelium dendriticum]|nr:unnamed protein product [Dicrocoelium dendriticum]
MIQKLNSHVHYLIRSPAIAFAPCGGMHQHLRMITGVLLKDGNPLPIIRNFELEDHPPAREFDDICIKLRTSISSKTGVPYDTVGCCFTSLIAPPNRTHVTVKIENRGTATLRKFEWELFLELERRRTNSTTMDLELQPHYAIRIAMGFFGDNLLGEWRGVYGSATEVMDIAETTCSKFEKWANTEKRLGYKNFSCVVTGQRWRFMKGVFFLHYESNEADATSLTNDALENRIITGVGNEITALSIEVLTATC